MPKINQEEYEVLKELDDKWKWIARTESGAVKTFLSKPHKRLNWLSDGSGSWDIKGNEDHAIYTTYSDLFQFIQWEDEEPHNIAELIEEYESEETEVKKDKLWAKIEVQEELESWWNIEGGIDEDGIKYVLNIIDQLDEPEVLSQEWISDHIIFNEKEDAEYIYADELQNLLVPKQEEVDQAYKDGYEKGKQHTLYKGYLEGLADKEKEPETVASVIADFYKSLERFKEVFSMEVEELEE